MVPRLLMDECVFNLLFLTYLKKYYFLAYLHFLYKFFLNEDLIFQIIIFAQNYKFRYYLWSLNN